MSILHIKIQDPCVHLCHSLFKKNSIVRTCFLLHNKCNPEKKQNHSVRFHSKNVFTFRIPLYKIVASNQRKNNQLPLRGQTSPAQPQWLRPTTLVSPKLFLKGKIQYLKHFEAATEKTAFKKKIFFFKLTTSNQHRYIHLDFKFHAKPSNGFRSRALKQNKLSINRINPGENKYYFHICATNQWIPLKTDCCT